VGSVQLDKITKAYTQAVCAVEDISFRIDSGQLVVLLGPSGCGKTTLLRMIAGLERPDTGRILIDGREVQDLDPRDRDIAMVFQNYALYPHMSVAENMGFGLKLRGMPRSQTQRRVREAASTLGLGDLLERRPAALSGGQRQRVALGRALVREPKVFLLDEPLSNLDAPLRASMRMEIARLQRALGVTMIYVTHDQIEAMTLGQRIVVMNEGRVQQIDTPMQVYERPANLFVATALGSPGINLLQGRLDRQGPTLQLDEGLSLPLAGLDAGHGALASFVDREVVVGLRPEALALHRDMPQAAALPAQLEVIERVGNEAFLHLCMGARHLVARVPPQDLPEPGTQVHIACRPYSMHVFDPASGLRIDTNA